MTVSVFSPDQSSQSCAKFKDQAHRIYTGGPYPLSGMNGLALANGHGPPHGQPRLNVDTNPLSDMDHMHHRSQSPPNHRDLYSGKPYPHVSCFFLSLSLWFWGYSVVPELTKILRITFTVINFTWKYNKQNKTKISMDNENYILV